MTKLAMHVRRLLFVSKLNTQRTPAYTSYCLSNTNIFREKLARLVLGTSPANIVFRCVLVTSPTCERSKVRKNTNTGLPIYSRLFLLYLPDSRAWQCLSSNKKTNLRIYQHIYKQSINNTNLRITFMF